MSKPKTNPSKPHPLETLCLRNHWSYQRLADEIAKVTGLKRDQSAWGRICQFKARPNRLTRDAIDQFLASARSGAEASR